MQFDSSSEGWFGRGRACDKDSLLVTDYFLPLTAALPTHTNGSGTLDRHSHSPDMSDSESTFEEIMEMERTEGVCISPLHLYSGWYN